MIPGQGTELPQAPPPATPTRKETPLELISLFKKNLNTVATEIFKLTGLFTFCSVGQHWSIQCLVFPENSGEGLGLSGSRRRVFACRALRLKASPSKLSLVGFPWNTGLSSEAACPKRPCRTTRSQEALGSPSHTAYFPCSTPHGLVCSCFLVFCCYLWIVWPSLL